MYIHQKFDLIQQIHREQAEDEKSFYRIYQGKNNNVYSYDQLDGSSKVTSSSSFRLRFLLAILFFLMFFAMEQKEIVLEGIGSSEIVEYISCNYEINMPMYDF